MTMRAVLADAVRPFGPGGRLLESHMPAFNALADALGLPADDAAPAGSFTTEPSVAAFEAAARRLGCSVAQIRAVYEVEAQGSGWFTDLRGDILALDGPGGFIDGTHLPKILFEAHIFDRETDGRFRKSHPNLSSAKWNKALYVGGQGEYGRLHRAMQLDRTAALRSASCGAAQIMGFNHRLAGYATVDAFVEAMKTGAQAQLMAFVAFVENSGLAPALRQITTYHASAVDFAEAYNGPAYARNQYHVKIAQAFKRWRDA